MFILLGLALLSQASIAAAQYDKMGSGLKVYPNTGPLDNFKGIAWRYNGEMQPWGIHSDLDFVPMIKDESAFNALEADPFRWVASPEITSVFSFERPYDHDITAKQGVFYQERIAKQLFGNTGMGLVFGSPSINGSHGSIDSRAGSWLGDFDTMCVEECRWDFLALDYEGDNPAEFLILIEDLHKKYSKPIWIKSFTCTTKDSLFCTPDTAQSFMRTSIMYFRSREFVERWAWDGADPESDASGDPSGMLMVEDGILSLTPTGQLYLDA